MPHVDDAEQDEEKKPSRRRRFFRGLGKAAKATGRGAQRGAKTTGRAAQAAGRGARTGAKAGARVAGTTGRGAVRTAQAAERARTTTARGIQVVRTKAEAARQEFRSLGAETAAAIKGKPSAVVVDQVRRSLRRADIRAKVFVPTGRTTARPKPRKADVIVEPVRGGPRRVEIRKALRSAGFNARNETVFPDAELLIVGPRTKRAAATSAKLIR